MYNSKFFGSVALFLMLILVGYFILIDKVIILPDESAEWSYKQFILRHTDSPKVIVDGGSNVHHGMNPVLLSEYFGVPVLNLGDSAAYPLMYKIFNFSSYLARGDILILPLEWNNYVRGSVLPDIFVESILRGEIAFYYRSLPLIEKIKFVFTGVPIRTALQTMISLYQRDTDTFTRNDSAILQVLETGGRASFGASDKKRENTRIDNGSNTTTCDEYTISKIVGSAFEVSQEFVASLELLKDLEHRGVQIFFTYPTVVSKDDEPCYQSKVKGKFEASRQVIEDQLDQYGFKMLGTIEESTFSKEYFLNTYFHVTSNGADIRTKALIARLKEARVKPLKEVFSTVEYNRNLRSAVSDNALHPLSSKASFLKFDEDGNGRYLLVNGWHSPEKWGVWSDGPSSRLEIPLPESPGIEKFEITLETTAYVTPKHQSLLVKVFQNGIQLDSWEYIYGSQEQQRTLRVNGAGSIALDMLIKDPVSPISLGYSGDSRMLGLGLSQIKINAISTVE